jgi:hypothetical protein
MRKKLTRHKLEKLLTQKNGHKAQIREVIARELGRKMSSLERYIL